jgi:hypothetical protein
MYSATPTITAVPKPGCRTGLRTNFYLNKLYPGRPISSHPLPGLYE